MFGRDTEDLFGIFSNTGANHISDSDSEDADSEDIPSTTNSTSKRPHPDPPSTSNPPHGKTHFKLDSSAVDSEMPVIADSFETSAQTEYQAAKYDAETGKEAEVDEKVVLSHQIRHQVALPPGYPYTPISAHKPSDNPARTYPFKLDPFQATAIASIERNESVLVAAHTSAGKTVVAEYAIATALRNKQRVIYTSPIKALSNQKYRDLLEEFSDVGLQTGDVTINPNASCLVMTTEILRSMMYRGSEHMREVAWVVFDEVHYMRDKERGVVWEETMVLLPHKVRYVFLSATIPNAMQFANWICRIHNQPCHVVYTDFRPTPLQHYIFPAGGDGIHLCVDEKSQFREDNFSKAITKIAPSRDRETGRKGGKKDAKGQTDLFKIIRMIWTRNYQPVIVFSFSKRECESNGLQIAKLDFNSAEEKDMVSTIFQSAISSLNDDDRKLPQIEHIYPLLKRGIGIHHSGLLPILKEVIEILFQEGLIKVLFATETFSIGLNMPAKTVVFTDAFKFDGKSKRLLGSGEYIQMSGRAGRRGLDDRGIVILMVSADMKPEEARTLLLGEADALNSAFQLKYNMILNLMRVEGISPEFILRQSFYQFQSNERLPLLEDQIAKLEVEKDEFMVDNEVEVADYYDVRKQLETYRQDFRDVIHHPSYILPFLQPGRLAKLKDYGWSVIVSFTKKEKKFEDRKEVKYIVDVLVHGGQRASEEVNSGKMPTPCPSGDRGEMVIIPAELSLFENIASIRIFLPSDLRAAEKRNSLINHMNEVKRRFPDGVPLLDPIEDMNIKDPEFIKLVRKIEVLENRLADTKFYKSPEDPELRSIYTKYCEKMELVEKIRTLKKELKLATSIVQLDELKYRKRVLRRLGFTSQSDVIEQKGRVACEISAGDELVLTELLFNNVFNDMSPEMVAALLSCFVYEERGGKDDSQVLKGELVAPYKILVETARRIAKVSLECKIPIDEEEYVKGFQKSLMNIVYAWAQGSPFSEICKMTDVFEGSIIRSMRRLEELLRSMVAASKQIGNEMLEEKFRDAIKIIKRDIVFAASLYLLLEIKANPTRENLLALDPKLSTFYDNFHPLFSFPSPRPEDKETLEKNANLPGLEFSLSEATVNEVIAISEKLNVDYRISAHLLEYATPRTGEFGKSVIEASILSFYSLRQIILKCILQMCLIAFSAELPEEVLLVLIGHLRNLLSSKNPSFVERLLSLLSNHSRDIFSLLIEEKLGVDAAIDHAARQNLTLSKAYERLKMNENQTISAAMGVCLCVERNVIIRILSLICWNEFISLDDTRKLFSFLQKTETSEPALPLLISCGISQVELHVEAIINSKTKSRSDEDEFHVHLSNFKELYASISSLLKESWKDSQIHSALNFLWITSVKKTADKFPKIENELGLSHAKCEEILEEQISKDVFDFFKVHMLPFVSMDDNLPSDDFTSSGIFSRGEDYLKLFVTSIMDSMITFMTTRMIDLIRKLKIRDEDSPISRRIYRSHVHESSKILSESSDILSPRRKDAENLLELIALVYKGRENSGLETLDSKRSFLKTIYDDRLSLGAKRAYFYMLSSLSCGQSGAQAVYDMLSSFSSSLSWEWIFGGIDYYTNAFQVAAEQGVPSELSPDDVTLMQAVLELVKQVVTYSPTARFTLNESLNAVKRLFNLLSARVPKELKAPVLRALSAFCYADGLSNISLNIPWTIWSEFERVQIVPANGQGGIPYDLEIIESKDETYPQTHAFLGVLCTLIHPFSESMKYSIPLFTTALDCDIRSSNITLSEFITTFGSHGEPPAILKYVNFVIFDVLGKINKRSYRFVGEKWKLMDEALDFIERCILGFDLNNMLQTYHSISRSTEIVTGSASLDASKMAIRNIVAHPGFIILARLFSGEQFLSAILYPISETVDSINKPSPISGRISSCVARSMRIILKACDLQEAFISRLLPIIRESSESNILMKVLPSRSFSGLDVYFGQNPNTIVSIIDFINTQNNDELCLLSVKLASFLANSSLLNSAESSLMVSSTALNVPTMRFGSSMDIMNRLVRLISEAPEMNRIQAAFVNRLLDIFDDSRFSGDLLIEKNYITIIINSPENNLRHAIRMAIVGFISSTVSSIQSECSLGHLLLGYNCKLIRGTEFRHPNQLSETFPKTGLHALLEIIIENQQEVLSFSQNTQNQRTDELIRHGFPLCLSFPKFYLKVLQLLLDLCSNEQTSAPTMRYLRYCEDYFTNSAKSMFGVIYGTHLPLNQQEALFPFFAVQLEQRAVELQLLALEFHVALRNNETRHAQKLLPYLLHLQAQNHEDMYVDETSKLLSVLESICKLVISPVQIITSDKLRFLKSINFKVFETQDPDGVQSYDILRMKEFLHLYLKNMEVSGSLRHTQLVDEATEEIKQVLTYYSHGNTVLYLEFARLKALKTWSQLSKVILKYLGDDLGQSAEILSEILLNTLLTLQQSEFPKIQKENILKEHPSDFLCEVALTSYSYLKASSTLSPLNGFSNEKLLQSFKYLIDILCTFDLSKAASGCLFSAIVCHITYMRNTDIQKQNLCKKSWSILERSFEKLISLICSSASVDGLDPWKATAFMAITSIFSLRRTLSDITGTSKILEFIRKRNYLKFFIDEIKKLDDPAICKVIQEEQESNATPIFIFEAKISLLVTIAQDSQGAASLVTLGLLDILSNLKFIRLLVRSSSISGYPLLKSYFTLISTVTGNIHHFNGDDVSKVLSFLHSQMPLFSRNIRLFLANGVITYDSLEELERLTSTLCFIAQELPLFASVADSEAVGFGLLSVLVLFCLPNSWNEKITLEKVEMDDRSSNLELLPLIGANVPGISSTKDALQLKTAIKTINSIMRNILMICSLSLNSTIFKKKSLSLFSSSVGVLAFQKSKPRSENEPSLGHLIVILKSTLSYLLEANQIYQQMTQILSGVEPTDIDLDDLILDLSSVQNMKISGSNLSPSERQSLIASHVSKLELGIKAQVSQLMDMLETCLYLVHEQISKFGSSDLSAQSDYGIDYLKFKADVFSALGSDLESLGKLKIESSLLGPKGKSRINFIQMVSRRTYNMFQDLNKK